MSKSDGKKLVKRLVPVFMVLILALVVSVLVWGMWKGSDTRLKAIAADKAIPDTVALEKIARTIWPERIKKLRVEKISSGEYELEVIMSYGSIVAFGDVGEEKIRRTDEFARGALRCFRAGKDRRLAKLVLQLETPVKSAFGNRIERIIAYRTILYLQDVEKIPQWETCNINEDAKQKIRNLWHVKFDRFDELR
ncbi:MAG: hypothetical protein PHO00_03235 [bacterium]|nr:hypothetical protein [bacterium]